MKVLIVVSALLAVALATAPDVPADTPEVAQAKLAHFAAHAEVKARTAGYPYLSPYFYSGYYPHYIPADTVEVAQAKAAHFAAHAQAKGNLVGVVPPFPYTSFPVDTPEVAQAKVAHFAAHVEAKTRNGDYYAYGYPFVHYRKRRAAYSGPQHFPVIANGVPVETPEVVAAKASHAAAHVAASHGAVAPVTNYAPYVTPYVAPYVAPVIANGVPVDAPDVAHAKVAHFAAHAEVRARNGDAPFDYYYHPAPVAHGAPLDTPEVAHAKAAHFAAHAEANARNGVYSHYY